MANTVVAHEYKVSLSFFQSEGGKEYKINPEFIRYIVIENLYATRIMPAIYISLAVEAELANRITKTKDAEMDTIEHRNKSFFHFVLHRKNKLSDLALFETDIDDKFWYLLSNNNPDFATELEDEDQNADVAFKTITVALISKNLTNAAKAEWNQMYGILTTNVYGHIDTATILTKALEGLDKYNVDVVMKPPIHNAEYGSTADYNATNTILNNTNQTKTTTTTVTTGKGKKRTARQSTIRTIATANQINTINPSLVVSPMNGRKQIIDLLFDRAPFYDTPFTFFMDFGRAYLVDQTGKGFKVKDNTKHNVIFAVTDAVDENSYKEGIDVTAASYIVHINPANIKIVPNDGQEYVANTLISVREDSMLEAIDILSKSGGKEGKKFVFKRGGNARLYKNVMESNTVTIEFVKDNIDGIIFTPNKHYMLTAYGKYKKYEGDYILVYKREIIRNNDGVFGCSCEIGMRRAADEIQDIGDQSTEVNMLNADTVQKAIAGQDITALNKSSSSKGVNEKSLSYNGSENGRGSSGLSSTLRSSAGPGFNIDNYDFEDDVMSGGSSNVVGAPNPKQYKNGNTESQPLTTPPHTFSEEEPHKTLSIEEQLKLAENKKVKRIGGYEVDNRSAGPVITKKDNTGMAADIRKELKYID